MYFDYFSSLENEFSEKIDEIKKACEIHKKILEIGSWFLMLDDRYLELSRKWGRDFESFIERFTFTQDNRLCFVGGFSNKKADNSKPIRFFVKIHEILNILNLSKQDFIKYTKLYELARGFARSVVMVKEHGLYSVEVYLEENGLTCQNITVPFWFITKLASYLLPNPIIYWQPDYQLKLPIKFLDFMKDEPNEWEVSLNEENKFEISGSGSIESLAYKVISEIQKILWDEFPKKIEFTIDYPELTNNEAFNWYLQQRFFLNTEDNITYELNLSE